MGNILLNLTYNLTNFYAMPKLPLILLSFFLIVSCSRDSEPKEEPDVIAPVIEFSIAGVPNNNSGEPPVVSNQIVVNINAQDQGGISKIEAFINDEKVGEDISAPYSIVIDISSYTSKVASTGKYENYTLKVTATDLAGNTSSVEQGINIDNELPTISDVSLIENTVLNGAVNSITFGVMDNEELSSVKIFINEQLLTEITDANFEVNIDTSSLSDGENMLKIEAKDSAENTGTHLTSFIVDNTGPEITIESITNGQIIDEPIGLAPQASDLYSSVSSFEILNGDTSLVSFDKTATDYQFNLDPEIYSSGTNILLFKATDDLGNESIMEVPIEIYRRLITINIPEDRLNAAIVIPLVIISRMDGSLLAFKEILNDDRQITISVPEEFTVETEFMVTFYLQDNGNMVGLSTHQNLTRNNPGTIDLPVPNRESQENGYQVQVPIANFFSNDFLLGQSGWNNSYTWTSTSSNYTTYLNTSGGYLDVGMSGSKPFDSIYLYESSNALNYRYMLVESPIDNAFVLDKNELTNTNVETKSLTVQSNVSQGNEYSNLLIFGAFTDDDKLNNRFHQINHFTRTGNVGIPMDYDLNTSFSYFKHSFLFGKYYTERNGAPLTNYSVPDVIFDYTHSDNVVNLNIQGSEHILGRMHCIDFDNLNYGWYITFNSQSTTNIVIPDLPENLSHPVATAQKNGNIKVESVELLSYDSITDYNDYIGKVIKNQTNILEATDWYQLIYSSRTGNFNRPNREFIFQ